MKDMIWNEITHLKIGWTQYHLKLFGHIHRRAFNVAVRRGLTQVEEMKKAKGS